MRVPRVLALSLLVCSCAAPMVAQSLGDKAPALPQSQANGSLPAARAAGDSIQRPVVARYVLDKKLSVLAENKGVCYTMRSYGFAQDDAKSDMTRPVSYSTCQPSKQFEMKRAVETQVVTPR
jgi:hypothetical protein